MKLLRSQTENFPVTLSAQINSRRVVISAYFILPHELDSDAVVENVFRKIFVEYVLLPNDMRFLPHSFDLSIEIRRSAEGYLAYFGIKPCQENFPDELFNIKHQEINRLSPFYL